MSTKRRYSAEFKKEAVRLMLIEGRPAREVAEELGVARNLLYRWKSDHVDELEAEGSLAQEYIASVIDSYYGLWGPWDEAEGGMWGIYVAKTRDEMTRVDPAGHGRGTTVTASGRHRRYPCPRS